MFAEQQQTTALPVIPGPLTATGSAAVPMTTGPTLPADVLEIKASTDDVLNPNVNPATRLSNAMISIMKETKRDPATVRRGDFVDYVLPMGANKGQVRTALVCRIWTRGNPVVQLVVFTDGLNDFSEPNRNNGIFWATSVRYAEPVEGNAFEINTWHWPSGE